MWWIFVHKLGVGCSHVKLNLKSGECCYYHLYLLVTVEWIGRVCLHTLIISLNFQFNYSFSELSNLPNWQDSVLQRLVKQFVSTRFPIYLVLNKADVPSAEDNIKRWVEDLNRGSMLTRQWTLEIDPALFFHLCSFNLCL